MDSPDRCAPPKWSREQKAAMLESVMPFIRKMTAKTGVFAHAREDLEQDCYLALWKALDSYDETKAKVVTFAGIIARQTIAECNRQLAIQAVVPAIGHYRHDKTVTLDPADRESRDLDDVGRDLIESAACEVEFAAKLGTGFLCGFSEKEIRLVRMIAVEGLTVDQVAEQLGQHVKMIELNLRYTVRKMIERNQLPMELVARFRESQRLNELNPARRPARSRSYDEQQKKRKGKAANRRIDRMPNDTAEPR